MSVCQKCEGKGFIEFEHGLIMVECDECGGRKEIDDSSSGTEQLDNSTGSTSASEPEKPKKPRAKKKARKRTR